MDGPVPLQLPFFILGCGARGATHESRVLQGAWQVVPPVGRLTSKWCATARAPME